MKIKKLISFILFISVIGSSEFFAAIVSDNDGAAFITKAEYDSYRNNFQQQLNQFNTSIDDKLNSAISSYLEGIKVKKELIEDFIGAGHGTREFVRTFGLQNTNRLGDFARGISAVAIEGCSNDQTWRSTDDAYFNMMLMTFDTGYAAEPYAVSVGGTIGKDMLLYIRDSSFDSIYKVASSQLECVPFTAWYGYFTGHSSYPQSTGYTKPANFKIERSGNTWGYQSGTLTVNAGNRDYTCYPNSVFLSLDTVKTENVLNLLAGSTVPTAKLYTLHLDDRSKIGPQSTYVPINKGWLRIRYNGSHPQDSANNWLGDYRLITYHHDYKNIYALSDLIVDTLSSSVDSPVRYYSGLPLFKASQDGTVTMKIKIVNGGNETSEVAIKSGQFENVTFSKGISLDSASANWEVNDVKTWPSNFNSNQEYKLEFDVKNGKYYYIKVLPKTNNYNSVVNIVGDIENVGS